MSRVGESPILIPTGVTVEHTAGNITVSGPKGNLNLHLAPEIKFELEGSTILFKRKNDQKRIKALHGLMRSLLSNMVVGVTEGWTKDLELVGVGFRAQVNGNDGSSNKLTLNVGYSHPVEVEAPEGISFEVLDNTKIKVSGIDKNLVGQIAANLKKVRVPDVYKGKGIRYSGEYIRKKVGKSAKVGAPGAGAK
ncbi:50S ribosomal protein L6 [Candidatus Daviesbacteria bacterium RIFCSPHIGHO2_02_FULL_36_13]|uniref:Large ribosomal subunit protein uL6 n=1 Tax=Candidatus Daviesbacteria bacterium RIFCSPHIGHO2_02_FULL_36_13 TaxID=1797768 RepID=A0A1F5JZD2_9BACT|nr:MAG: 50S ribosomal protein L6 [Candidatus Daviesbacteria bacterium RIFCSPHIGHO2_02_FULL_36_13]OGE44479.1 MAG: 50S ribosomal protein L6 [Candidatus Daviesbacteria bacterium RIFCSPLOWO2_01_FULL_36_8]